MLLWDTECEKKSCKHNSDVSENSADDIAKSVVGDEKQNSKQKYV